MRDEAYQEDYNKTEVRNAYASMLSGYEWDSFYTLTCRKPRKDTIAFVRDIRQTLFNENYQTRSFVAIEPHKTGMLHAHGLVHWNDALDKEYVGRYFTRRARALFGFSRFQAAKSSQAVQSYVSKYVVKANDLYEYDFIGDW